MRKLTCPPEVETLGQNLSAFSDNLQGSQVQAIMKKYQIVDLDPMGWYPAHKLMSALNEIAETQDKRSNYVAIGMKIGEIVPMPPQMENPTLPEVLAVWDDLYQFLHRNGDAGNIRCEKVNDKHYKTLHSVIYPDDMSYGILYAYGRRFLPPGTYYKVFYDPDLPARDYGGTDEYSIIHIEWE